MRQPLTGVKQNPLTREYTDIVLEQFEQFILFKIQKAIDPSGNINI